jgi:hypothetical protein
MKKHSAQNNEYHLLRLGLGWDRFSIAGFEEALSTKLRVQTAAAPSIVQGGQQPQYQWQQPQYQ